MHLPTESRRSSKTILDPLSVNTAEQKLEYAPAMSRKFLRHSWLAIAAPFFAGGIIRAADSHWQSATILFGIGVSLVVVELVIVMRVRLRNPLYRLRAFKSDYISDIDELTEFVGKVNGFQAALIPEIRKLGDVLQANQDKVKLRTVQPAYVAEERKARKEIKRIEQEICDLFSEFRGFFFVPD
jgi:hypothetical protein